MHVCDRRRGSSCNSMAEIRIDAECERQLRHYLTGTCQIKHVVSAITDSVWFQAYSTRVRCKDNNRVAVTGMTECLLGFTGLG